MTIDGADFTASEPVAVGHGDDRRSFMKKVAVGGAVTLVWASPAITATMSAAAAASGVIPATGGTTNGVTATVGASTFTGKALAGAGNRTAVGSSMLVATDMSGNGNGSQFITVSFTGATVTKLVFTITGGANQTGENTTITSTGNTIVISGTAPTLTYTITGANITSFTLEQRMTGGVGGTAYQATVGPYTVTT